MASQMLASVKGMSAHHTERGERVHDRGFLWGVTANPDLRQDADRPLPARGRAAQARSQNSYFLSRWLGLLLAAAVQGETLAGRSLRSGRPLDGQPDVGQRQGHVRVHHTERGERVHDRGFLWMSQQTRTCARTPIGRYLRVGVRPRLNRTADLDGEVDAEPGLKIPGAVHHCPGRVG